MTVLTTPQAESLRLVHAQIMQLLEDSSHAEHLDTGAAIFTLQHAQATIAGILDLNLPYIELTFHHDMGHGWLAVPLDLVKWLGIEHTISHYSYYCLNNDNLYLEEDCDLSRFMDAIKGVFILKMNEHYVADSPIRNYPSFAVQEAQARYAVQVERKEGYSSSGTFFPHAFALMRHAGEIQTFDTRAEAEEVAKYYREMINEFTICEKVYTVVLEH